MVQRIQVDLTRNLDFRLQPCCVEAEQCLLSCFGVFCRSSRSDGLLLCGSLFSFFHFYAIFIIFSGRRRFSLLRHLRGLHLSLDRFRLGFHGLLHDLLLFRLYGLYLGLLSLHGLHRLHFRLFLLTLISIPLQVNVPLHDNLGLELIGNFGLDLFGLLFFRRRGLFFGTAHRDHTIFLWQIFPKLFYEQSILFITDSRVGVILNIEPFLAQEVNHCVDSHIQFSLYLY